MPHLAQKGLSFVFGAAVGTLAGLSGLALARGPRPLDLAFAAAGAALCFYVLHRGTMIPRSPASIVAGVLTAGAALAFQPEWLPKGLHDRVEQSQAGEAPVLGDNNLTEELNRDELRLLAVLRGDTCLDTRLTRGAAAEVSVPAGCGQAGEFNGPVRLKIFSAQAGIERRCSAESRVLRDKESRVVVVVPPACRAAVAPG